VSALGWENNPNGICEDAPCCGCCGPQGDGVIYDEPPDPDEFDYDYDSRWEEGDDS
jgi:hypothetical protein